MRSVGIVFVGVGYFLLVLLWIYSLTWRTWAFLILTLAFIPYVWLPGRRSGASEKTRPSSLSRGWSPLFLPSLLIFSGASYFLVGYFVGARFVPTAHDEYAYLFQAKTFAAFRLYYPAHPLGEFLQAFHILTEPVYASKYPPGHALFLVPGVWINFPAIVPILTSVASLALLFRLTTYISGHWMALATTAVFAFSPAQVLQATSFFSMGTSLFCVLVFLLNIMLWMEHSRWSHALFAGFGLGMAFLTRPYSALAVGTPVIAYCLFTTVKNGLSSQRSRTRQLLGMLTVPLTAVVLLLLYNRALVGDPLKFPWSEYAVQYIPADGLGFSAEKVAPKRTLLPNQMAFYHDYVIPAKDQYTLSNAIGIFLGDRIPSLLRSADPGLGITIFFLIGTTLRKTPAERLLLAVLVSHAVGYLLYYGSIDRYLFEIVPLVVYFSVKACIWTYRACRWMGMENALSFLKWQGAAGLCLLMGLQAHVYLRDKRKVTEYYVSFSQLLSTLGNRPKVIFVRYKPGHYYHSDLINNEPDVDASKTVFAYDLGRENEKVLNYYPSREVFLFDESSWVISAYPDQLADQ